MNCTLGDIRHGRCRADITTRIRAARTKELEHLKYTVTSLLLMTLAITVPLAGFVNRHRGRQRIERLAKHLNGAVSWHNQYSSPQSNSSSWEAPLKAIFGDNALSSISSLSLTARNELDGEVLTSILRSSSSLRGLEYLHLSVTPEFDCGLLANLDDVRLLEIRGEILSTAEMTAISDIEDLELLWLNGSKFDLQDVQVLANCKHLAWLCVSDKEFSREDVRQIRDLLPEVYVTCWPSP